MAKDVAEAAAAADEKDEEADERIKGPADFYITELWAELKLSVNHDAFITDYSNTENIIDGSTPSSRETLGQITSYATAQLARQHRNSIFSLLICGKHARFIRWDRAGSIISKHFDYIENPSLLTEFLARYGKLTDTGRGFDPTARLAAPDEKAKLSAAIDRHISDKSKRQFPDMKKVVDERVPCYRIEVEGFQPGKNKSIAEKRTYIVQRPFAWPLSPVGRSTRAYIALDLAEDKLVFLKDYWRPAEPDRVPEPDIYDALERAHVPHLAKVILAGDVPSDEKCTQATLTQEWRYKDGIFTTGLDLRAYRHIRVVQELLYPLKTAKNSRELVAALRNVIDCELSSWVSVILILNDLVLQVSMRRTRRSGFTAT